MTPARTFAAALLVTAGLTRLFLHLAPTPSPTVAGFRLHHWMTGLAVLAVGAVFGSSAIGGIGAGLFLDEAVFVLRRGRCHLDYVASLRPTVLLVGGTFAAIWLWA